MTTSVLILVLVAGCRVAQVKENAPEPVPPAEQVTPVAKHQFPDVGGRPLEAELLIVRYGPGASSEPHRHPCATVGYVLEGALRFAVDQDSARTLQAGESFSEAPNALHRVSANASSTEPVRFLVQFICVQGGTKEK